MSSPNLQRRNARTIKCNSLWHFEHASRKARVPRRVLAISLWHQSNSLSNEIAIRCDCGDNDARTPLKGRDRSMRTKKMSYMAHNLVHLESSCCNALHSLSTKVIKPSDERRAAVVCFGA